MSLRMMNQGRNWKAATASRMGTPTSSTSSGEGAG
jgi:hypothetical protein